MILQPGNYRIEAAPAMTKPIRVPSLRHHKPSRPAVVTINGPTTIWADSAPRTARPNTRVSWRSISPEASGPAPPSLISRSMSWPSNTSVCPRLLREEWQADERAGGYRVRHPASYRALWPLMAAEFGPIRLKAVRQAMIDSGLCRNEINKRVGKLIRMFKWAASEEMLPGSVFHALQAVTGLRRGRSGVRESLPVKPVPMEFVEAIRPFVSRQVWVMIQLQLLTGARSGEICHDANL